MYRLLRSRCQPFISNQQGNYTFLWSHEFVYLFQSSLDDSDALTGIALNDCLKRMLI
jgi:hypothetical protein